MNYRHAFHAGNFADVVKHAVLARILDYLKRKPGAFRVIDTHAGIGLYDLSGEEAQRTGEWRGGIGRLLETALPAAAAALIAPYLDAVRAFNPQGGNPQGGNPQGGIRFYPGSPLVARHLMRRIDRLTAIELHPEDNLALKAHFSGDWQARVLALDGWLALGAHVPPKEKRGLVLVDPPFEKEGEFDRLVGGLVKAHRRWPGGTYALWYPVKDRAAVAAFRARLGETGIAGILDIFLDIRAPSAEPRLDGCGIVVVNPPYVLEEEMAVLLPALGDALGEDGARTGLKWLTRQ